MDTAAKPQFHASVVSTGTNYLHRIRAGHFDLTTDEPKALGGQGDRQLRAGDRADHDAGRQHAHDVPAHRAMLLVRAHGG